MLNKVKLKNFQSHRDTTVELDAGLNALIGTSDHGKSTIINAIIWVKDNRPLGDEIVSHWNFNDKGTMLDDTSVTVDIDGYQVTRLRNKNDNGYIITGPDGKTNRYMAIGTSVPEEVTAIFNMSDVNVQLQMDPHFMLASGGGEVARFFNKTIKMELIDESLKEAAVRKRRITDQCKIVDERIDEKTTQLVGYAWADNAERDIELAEATIIRIDDTKNQLNLIESQLKQAANVMYTISVLDKIIATESLVVAVKSTQDELEKLDARKVKLSSLIESVENNATALREWNRIAECAGLLDDVFEAQEGANASKTQIQKLEQVTGAIRENTIELEHHDLVASADECLTKYIAVKQAYDNTNAQGDALSRLKNDLYATQAEQQRYDTIIAVEPALRSYKAAVLVKEDYNASISKLNGLITGIRCAEMELVEVDKTIAEFISQLPDVCMTCGAAKEHWGSQFHVGGHQ